MKTFNFIILFFFLINCESISNRNLEIEAVVSKNELYLSDYDKNLLLGKFDYKKDSSFVIISKKLSSKEIYINKVVNDSFLKMAKNAKKDGITLIVVSGTRNFIEQKRIWERKWSNLTQLSPVNKALKILEYSSMPSTSRHHWGTDIDLINLNNSYFNKGKGLEEYKWLSNNANKYGFFQVYTNKNEGRTGYNMEKWHWSFKPLSDRYLELYLKNINYLDIYGFKGSDIAKEIDVINKYVNGIE